jgi:cytochrome c oxidase subunit 2
VDNSVKLPVAALSVAVFFCVLTIGSLIVRTSGGGGGGEAALAAQGATLYTQLGCQGCHSVTGAAGVGPALNNVYNNPQKLDSGETVTADDTYMRAAILQPDTQIVEGYTAGVMSAGISGVLPRLNSGNTTDALLAYLKSISTAAPGAGASPSAGRSTATADAGSGTPRPVGTPTVR